MFIHKLNFIYTYLNKKKEIEHRHRMSRLLSLFDLQSFNMHYNFIIFLSLYFIFFFFLVSVIFFFNC
ncbi:hypothetical protein HanIR_Chr11g0556401 [Helianthus annuus]|nr:hypothetical protein HanIR_Chr11g0556401 [Helianthus annuus]